MEIILSSVIAFASTNIDDIFILALFFSNKKIKVRDIVIGQYVGITCLVAISFIGSFIGLVIAPQYIGLLGLIPVYLGIKGIISLNKCEDNDEEPDVDQVASQNRHKIFSVAFVTIANGGDNISIYVPLFAAQVISQKLTMILIFLLMTGIWCLLARYVTKHAGVKKILEKPQNEKVGNNGLLSGTHPSDHLSLYCEFGFRV